MRIAVLVGERVVLPVVGDPLRDRALHGHRAEDRERRAEPLRRLEAAVREQTVEPDGVAERARRVEDEEQDDVQPRQCDAPEQSHRGQESERRDTHGDQRHDLAGQAGALAYCADRDLGGYVRHVLDLLSSGQASRCW